MLDNIRGSKLSCATLEFKAEAIGRWLMILIVMCSSCGFLLIGYDNGVMGGLVNGAPFLDTFGLDAKRDANTIGTIVAIYEIGCMTVKWLSSNSVLMIVGFIGSLLSAFYAEKLGRKRTILGGSLFMIVGAILQACSQTRSQIIVGRIISGLGMGHINATVPILQAEMSTPKSRGQLACVQLSTLNAGIMMSYWVDYGFSKLTPAQKWHWRVPIALQIVFIVFLIVLALLIPESPRWLAAHGREEQALSVYSRLADRPSGDLVVENEWNEIMTNILLERQIEPGSSWSLLFRSDTKQSRRRFLIACSIQAAQQLGGINALIYFSGTIFQQSIQLSNDRANLVSGYLNTWFFLASFIPHPLIDRVGRRILLLTTITGMALCFAVEAGLIRRIQETSGSHKHLGIAAAAVIFLYQALFTIGFQAVVWVIPAEILPLHLRAKGSSVSTASNWIINYVVVQVTPKAIATIGWKFYVIFAILNASFLLPIYLFLPETAGLTLESVDALFVVGASSEAAGTPRTIDMLARNDNDESSSTETDPKSTTDPSHEQHV